MSGSLPAVPLTSSSEGGNHGAAAPAGSSGSAASSREGRLGLPLGRPRARLFAPVVGRRFGPAAVSGMDGGGALSGAASSGAVAGAPMLAIGYQMPNLTWGHPIPASPEQALRQELAQQQAKMNQMEYAERARTMQFEERIQTVMGLTGSKEQELGTVIAQQQHQLQWMAHEETQASETYAATQRQLQRMSDEDAYAVKAVGHLQHEVACKAGTMSEQVQYVHEMYQRECHAFNRLRDESIEQQQGFNTAAQRMRAEYQNAERIFGQMQLRDRRSYH